ncbi:hypothetical protein MLD38_021956 [Melastoma candidum]|uniref:Uncharacterized protein n=1 Tax=Melastoma candidum TaxID=119954 RepID=A0ACB9QJJ1_9MYRT|nr:hypothetical protein MLD38_021956 [Melastoma candidum]
MRGGASQTAPFSQKTWCIAKPSSDEATLIKNINFACSETSCKDIDIGGRCFLPDTLQNHASVAMNLYYWANGRNTWNCDFKGSRLIVTTDPSYAKCIYM